MCPSNNRKKKLEKPKLGNRPVGVSRSDQMRETTVYFIAQGKLFYFLDMSTTETQTVHFGRTSLPIHNVDTETIIENEGLS